MRRPGRLIGGGGVDGVTSLTDCLCMEKESRKYYSEVY